MTGFSEVARDVYVLRYPVLDVNVALVVGDGAALLVDTLSTRAQARELAAAARAVTGHPWALVNTHHHFDHCFGNAVLINDRGGSRGVWGHEETAALLATDPDRLRRQWYEQWVGTHPDLAAGLAEAEVVPPDRIVHQVATVDVGGRTVVLRHLGRGHTAGDLVVQVPDADVLVAGDLIEQSGPPSFEDSYPLQWPETLTRMRQLVGPATVVVPGHGTVVDRTFVQEQHDQLAALAWQIRDGHGDGAPPDRVAAAVTARTYWAHPVVRTAVSRGYAELAGRT